MAEPVSELIVAIRADISQLKTELEKARGETRKWGRINAQQTRDVYQQFKRLKEPISNVAQLANSLGTAFGGAASKATGLVNGVISSFAAGGAMGLAVGGITGLVSVLASKYVEAGEKAEAAAKKAVEASEKEAESIRDKLTALKAELRAKILMAHGMEGGAAQAAVALEDARKRADDLTEAAKRAREEANKAGAGSVEGGILRAIGGAAPVEEGSAADRATKAEETAGDARMLVREMETVAELDVEIKKNDKKTELAKKSADAIAKYEAEQREKGMALAISRIQQHEDEKVQIAAESGERVLEEQDAINALTIEAREKIAAREGEISLSVAATTAEAQAKIAEEAQRDAANLMSVGSQFAEVIGSFVGSLVEGFATFADFAKSLQRLLVGLIAQLVQAVVVAAILSALFGGTPAALGAVGGLTGVIGKGLGFSGFAEGGPADSRDTIPALLRPGEFVVTPEGLSAIGASFLDRANAAGRGRVGMASGGLVGGGGGKMGGDTYVIQAFDVPAVAKGATRLESVQTRRINNRQGALVRETLRRSLG